MNHPDITNINMPEIENINVLDFDPMPSPEEIHARVPLSEKAARTVMQGRDALRNILERKDHRLFIVIGPCSIHDVEAAKDYAQRLKVLADKVSDTLFLVMRRSYWLAALTLLGLGYTRAVAPALGLAILVHLVARARDERRSGTRLFAGDRCALIVLTVSVAVSALAWPATVGMLTGRPSAFFDVQKAWGQEPQNGPFVLWLAWAWEARGVFGLALIVGIVAAYLALVAGRHGQWLPLEVRAWALAYPLYLLAVVRPITSMWRFLLLDFPAAALVASVAMRTSAGERIVPHWRRRVALVALALCAGMAWWTVAFLTYVPWAATPP